MEYWADTSGIKEDVFCLCDYIEKLERELKEDHRIVWPSGFDRRQFAGRIINLSGKSIELSTGIGGLKIGDHLYFDPPLKSKSEAAPIDMNPCPFCHRTKIKIKPLETKPETVIKAKQKLEKLTDLIDPMLIHLNQIRRWARNQKMKIDR